MKNAKICESLTKREKKVKTRKNITLFVFFMV